MARSASRLRSTLARGAVTGVLLLAAMSSAVAQPAAGDSAAPGTQPVHSRAEAIRERVFVEGDFDSDTNGQADIIALDIVRPAATANGLKVPVIMDASPYYSTLGRGNESERKQDTDGDGLLDKFPLFYDNYFVPRGYAVVLLDMVGTNNSTGCPVTGGTPDNRSPVVAIDWLNGRRAGHDAAGNPVVADWHSGRTGIIGKSYDGMLAVAAAASGVDGLTTFVPIAPTTDYYTYTRTNGIVTRGSSYPSSLSNTVTNPERRAHCAATRDAMAAADGDETGDYSPFWAERDYLPDAGKVRASMFMTHGLQDDNVRTNHFSEWWYAMAANGVPRKLWLTGTGHIDPFDFRRAHWVDTLHRWFDYWLMGIDNGIMAEPMVDVETGPDVWESHGDWPVPGTQMLDIFLQPAHPLVPDLPVGHEQQRQAATLVVNGVLGLDAGATDVTTSFTDSTTQPESTMIANPTVATANRRVFLSEPLEQPLRLSGTPYVRLRAAADKVDTNLGALIVDYGTRTQISRTGDGITTTSTESCWGETTAADDACYKEVVKAVTTVAEWRVAKGILDAVNRDSLTSPTALEPGRFYDFVWDLLPNDYTFEAGHRIGIIIVGSYPGYPSQADSSAATITVDLRRSRISLPLVGGREAAEAAGIQQDNPVAAR